MGDGWTVAHLTTVDMSLQLLLGAQLDALLAAGAEAVGISAAGPFVDRLADRGVRHVALDASTRGWDPRADVRAARQLWRVLRRERPTVLHTHNPKPGLYGRVLGRLAGVPIIVNTVHGLYATPDDPLPKRVAVYVAEAFASRWSDAELVQNVEDVAVMRRWRLAPRRRIRHLGNGVDLERFRLGALGPDERRRLRAEWGADDETVVVGTVGRLVAEKGYRELFDVAGRLPSNVRMVVVGGEDPDKPDALAAELLRRADDAGVVRLGHRDDVDRVLGALDVFVLASHREGQPRAAMEAAATGLPVIATDIRGCRQVVDHEVTGVLVPVGDAAALETAIAATGRRARAAGGDGRRRSTQGRAGVRRAGGGATGAGLLRRGRRTQAGSRLARAAGADRPHPVDRRRQPLLQRRRRHVGEAGAQSAAIGLRVRHVAGPHRLVLADHRMTELGFDQGDQRQEVDARAEGEVDRIRVRHPAHDGVGEHRGHRVDEREVTALRAVAEDRERSSGQRRIDERRHDRGVGVARRLARPEDVEEPEGQRGQPVAVAVGVRVRLRRQLAGGVGRHRPRRRGPRASATSGWRP